MRAVWVGILTVAVACGTPATPVPLDELAQTNAEIYCERLFECCAGYELEARVGPEAAASVDACVASQVTGFARVVDRWAGSVAAGATTYDAQRMGECLEDRRTESCVAFARHQTVWGGCETVLQGQLPLDAPCGAHHECASGLCRLEVLPGDDTPTFTTCGSMPGVGEDCVREYLCEDGLVCFAADGCQAPLPNGSPCFVANECDSHYCTSDYSTAGECADGPLACDGIEPDLSDCDEPLPCPPGPSGAPPESVCGRLVDFETGEPIRALDADGGACDPASPTADGPCSLAIRVYLLQDLALQPDTAVAIEPDELTVDSCGRFAAIGIPGPDEFFHMVLLVDDAAGADDRHVPSATSYETTPGFGVTRELPLLEHETDMKWSQALGETDATIADTGAVVLRHFFDGAPAQGVDVFNGAATAVYFDDASPDTAASLAPATTTTGANGAALIVGPPGAAACSDCGLSSGCAWPTKPLPAELPSNTVVFIRRDAQCP